MLKLFKTAMYYLLAEMQYFLLFWTPMARYFERYLQVIMLVYALANINDSTHNIKTLWIDIRRGSMFQTDLVNMNATTKIQNTSMDIKIWSC